MHWYCAVPSGLRIEVLSIADGDLLFVEIDVRPLQIDGFTDSTTRKGGEHHDVLKEGFLYHLQQVPELFNGNVDWNPWWNADDRTPRKGVILQEVVFECVVEKGFDAPQMDIDSHRRIPSRQTE
jgi:hypothetical protein